MEPFKNLSGQATSKDNQLSASAMAQPNPRLHASSAFAMTRQITFLAQVAADLVAILASIALAGLIAWFINIEVLHIHYQAFDAENLNRRLFIWVCLASSLCVWFGLTGTYTARRPLQDDMKQAIGSLVVVLMIDGFLQFTIKETFSRLWIFLVWPAAAILLPVARITVRRLLDAAGIWRIGAAVFGSGEHYASVERSLMGDIYVGYYVAYHSTLAAETDEFLSVMSAKLSADMRLCKAETAIIVPSDAEIGLAGRIMDALNLNLISYVLIPPIKRLPFAGLSIQSVLNSDAILMTSRTGLLSPARQAAKRIVDVVVVVTLTVILAPILILLSLLIMLNGGSPVFGHLRVGRDGRPFRCLKFRTMAKNADRILADLIARDPEVARQWRMNFKLDNDPRITPIGKFLRKTSLDELPQLFNVLKGEMSLVGPRPVVAEELTRYYGEDAFYYKLVRPGITGLWQVSGRSQTSYERRVFLDSWYVRNWNLWTDLVILFNTVPTAILGTGAQ